MPGGRKCHQEATALHGGLAMFLALLPAMLVLLAAPSEKIALILSAAILVVVGMVDDFRPFSARLRFILQCASALLLCVSGGAVLSSFGNLLATGPIILGGHGLWLGVCSLWWGSLTQSI